jgi:hypothetical protein
MGWGAQLIARELGIARNMMRRYLRGEEAAEEEMRPLARCLDAEQCEHAIALLGGEAEGNAAVVKRLFAADGVEASLRTVQRAVEEIAACSARSRQRRCASRRGRGSRCKSISVCTSSSRRSMRRRCSRIRSTSSRTTNTPTRRSEPRLKRLKIACSKRGDDLVPTGGGDDLVVADDPSRLEWVFLLRRAYSVRWADAGAIGDSR